MPNSATTSVLLHMDIIHNAATKDLLRDVGRARETPIRKQHDWIYVV